MCALYNNVCNRIILFGYQLIAGVSYHEVILSPTNSSTHFVIHTHLHSGDNRSECIALLVQDNSDLLMMDEVTESMIWKLIPLSLSHRYCHLSLCAS